MNFSSNNCRRNAFPASILVALLIAVGFSHAASAGLIQWRNRIPAGASNNNGVLGSYTNAIEVGNGGTTGYDPGLDVTLDTSIVPNDRFFVTYINHSPHKVEYEFTQQLHLGESYTALLSFENNSLLGSAFTPNTIEFLAVDGAYTYELAVDTNDDGNADTFRSGPLSIGEVTPWNQALFPSNDHRHGWYYGELTITSAVPEPTGLACVGFGLAVLSICRRSRSAHSGAT